MSLFPINGSTPIAYGSTLSSISDYATSGRPAIDSFIMASGLGGYGLGMTPALRFTPVLNPNYMQNIASYYQDSMAWCNFPGAFQSAMNGGQAEQGVKNYFADSGYFGGFDFNAINNIQIDSGEKRASHTPPQVPPKPTKPTPSSTPSPSAPSAKGKGSEKKKDPKPAEKTPPNAGPPPTTGNEPAKPAKNSSGPNPPQDTQTPPPTSTEESGAGDVNPDPTS